MHFFNNHLSSLFCVLVLLNTGGVLSYICSNKYFRSGYGEKLRDFLGKNTTIQQLVDFGDTDVFTAIAYPSIILFSKEKA
ncbi:MAG: Eco57I restriction-modification methylase domain-containing protein, partial [Pseudanabaena sp.]